MIKGAEKKVLDIREATLLSIEEAELAKQNVPDILRKNAHGGCALPATMLATRRTWKATARSTAMATM